MTSASEIVEWERRVLPSHPGAKPTFRKYQEARDARPTCRRQTQTGISSTPASATASSRSGAVTMA